MATFNRFEDIEAWQKSRTLAKLIHDLTFEPIYEKDKKLKFQMLSSSGSVMDNIAEGWGRGGSKEFKQFLWISKGSAAELRSQLYRSLDKNFISNEKFQDYFNRADEIEKMLKGLINHLTATENKGIKYKNIS